MILYNHRNKGDISMMEIIYKVIDNRCKDGYRICHHKVWSFLEAYRFLSKKKLYSVHFDVLLNGRIKQYNIKKLNVY